MTMDLVTGMGPGPHIDGRAAGELNAGLIGPDDYVLQIGDRLACTMQTANKAIIGTGAAVMQGRHVSITAPETVTIQSGTQGQKRSDLICLRYERDLTTSIESARLVAYKGEPTTGTPADPAIDKSSILALDASHDMPLYRIPLDGITVGAPIPLFSVLTPVGVPRTRNVAVTVIDGKFAVLDCRIVDGWVHLVFSLDEKNNMDGRYVYARLPEYARPRVTEYFYIDRTDGNITLTIGPDGGIRCFGPWTNSTHSVSFAAA